MFVLKEHVMNQYTLSEGDQMTAEFRGPETALG